MISLVKKILSTDDTRGRVSRSFIWVILGFGGSNLIRLLSNLILTRLLFPEAFGLLALVQVFIAGLWMMSDIGLNVSIVQSPRGEDQKFLNTVWSMQILRGIILWIGTCLLAYPASIIYDEPSLIQFLPVVGLSSLIVAFGSTKLELANRNLQIGTRTFIELSCQMIGAVTTVILAWLTESIWSLVLGGLLSSVIFVILGHVLMKGPSNYWYFNKEFAWEIFHFGKFISLSSLASFFIQQSDRAILGVYVSLADLGIFTVGYLFASIPLLLAHAVDRSILQPLYRKYQTSISTDNQKKVNKVRLIVLTGMVFCSGCLSLISVPLVDILYDDRYAAAGPIMALMGFSVTASIALGIYDGAYLSHGNSKSQFYINFKQSILQVIFSFILIHNWGVVGASLVAVLTFVFVYPFRARLAARYGAWQPKADILSLVLGFILTSLACWLYFDEVKGLFS